MKDTVKGVARGEIAARLLDLSMGGALVQLEVSLEEHAIHDFALQIDGRTVWVQGEVRRSIKAPRGPGYEVGIAFLGIDPQDERVLREYLEQSRPS